MKTKLSKKEGQLLVDFVNADSTEKAVLSCFNNLQRNFSFSADFCKKVNALFPSLHLITAKLKVVEKKLLDLILKKNRLIERLNAQLKSINYSIESYEPLTRTISLISLEWKRNTGECKPEENPPGVDEPRGGGFLETLKLLGLCIVDGPVSIKIDAIKGEIEALLGPYAAEQLDKLVKIGQTIEELVSGLEEGSYEQLFLQAEKHKKVIELYNSIDGFQSDCRVILEMIVEDRPFNEIPAFATCLEIYNSIPSRRLIIGEDNRLLPVSPMDESRYLLAIHEVDDWREVLRKDIAYCLVEFFKSDKSINYLKKCRTCHEYFIARQPQVQKFCKKDCRLSWHKRPKIPSVDKIPQSANPLKTKLHGS